MSIFKKIMLYVKNPHRVYERSAIKKLQKEGYSLSDEVFLKKMFKIKLGYELNLVNPQTFNEKMQFLKLYNRQPIYTTMADKHAVKEYVTSKVGEEYIAKEFGCWSNVDEIDFDKLPNKFVLKTTHGCGGIKFLDKEKGFSKEELRNFFERGLKLNYYLTCREWPYKDIKPQIIAEEFLKDEKYDVLPVYKLFCFNGEPFIAQIIQNDKQSNETVDYVDMNWNFLKLKQDFPNSKKSMRIPKPEHFEEMKEIARNLSKDIPFVRCDLYVVNGKIYFSEFTFFSDAGFEKFHPKEWDLILGNKIDITPLLVVSNK